MSTLIEKLEEIKYFLEEEASFKYKVGQLGRNIKARASLAKDALKRAVSKRSEYDPLTGGEHHKKQERRKAAIRAAGQMKRAKKRGQTVVHRKEGGGGEKAFRVWARGHANKKGVDYEEGSLEHRKSDPTDPKSDVAKLVRKKRGRKKGEADRKAFLRGGNPKDTFPRDYGLPATKRSKIVDLINRARRVGHKRVLRGDVRQGKQVIGQIGAGHKKPDYLKKGKSGKYVGEQVK